MLRDIVKNYCFKNQSDGHWQFRKGAKPLNLIKDLEALFNSNLKEEREKKKCYHHYNEYCEVCNPEIRPVATNTLEVKV
jgi:hypothetical protein